MSKVRISPMPRSVWPPPFPFVFWFFRTAIFRFLYALLFLFTVRNPWSKILLIVPIHIDVSRRQHILSSRAATRSKYTTHLVGSSRGSRIPLFSCREQWYPGAVGGTVSCVKAADAKTSGKAPPICITDSSFQRNKSGRGRYPSVAGAAHFSCKKRATS